MYKKENGKMYGKEKNKDPFNVGSCKLPDVESSKMELPEKEKFTFSNTNEKSKFM